MAASCTVDDPALQEQLEQIGLPAAENLPESQRSHVDAPAME